MSTSAHQQAAIRRLEALFRDVKLEQHHPDMVKVEIDSSCCDIHGKHAKENCWNRRGSIGASYQYGRGETNLGRRDGYQGSSPGRRGSLGLPMSPPKKELHPSSFPNTLRKSPLGSSMGAINHTRKDFYAPTLTGSPLRRDAIGRSMGCLKKDTASSYNSPLRRDYVAKSMTSLQRTMPPRRDANNLSSLFPTSHNDPSRPVGLVSSPSNNDPKTRGPANLKSCLAGSSGNLRNNLNVTLSTDLSNGNLKKDGKSIAPLSNRRGSYDRRRLSTDSLDNTKRNSWDPGRRGSSGSSGGWDDPIWEEGTFDADQVKYSNGWRRDRGRKRVRFERFQFLENPNRTDETCEKFVRNNSRGIAQKFCPILLTTDEESRATTRSLIVSAAFPRGTREIIFPSTYTHARAMVKCKKMRGSIVVARADRIYRCLLDCAQPAVGNCHSRRRTKRPVHRSVSNEFYSDRNLFRSDKISASRTRFSPFLEIDSRETSIIVVSPSSHFTKLSSVVRNVRSNEFRESVDLRATVPAVLRYFSCGAVTC